jgi:thiol-disulfide isomerase/thioredoxin
MIERAVISFILLIVGYEAYRLFTRYHVRLAAASALSDPILRDVKPGVPVIVYFSTPTCAPCRTQQWPALTRLQDELGDAVQIVKIDATENTEAADRWGVFSAPTTFVLDSRRRVREVNHGVAETWKLKRQIETAEIEAVKIHGQSTARI